MKEKPISRELLYGELTYVRGPVSCKWLVTILRQSAPPYDPSIALVGI